jgi:hypothetical protein
MLGITSILLSHAASAANLVCTPDGGDNVNPLVSTASIELKDGVKSSLTFTLTNGKIITGDLVPSQFGQGALDLDPKVADANQVHIVVFEAAGATHLSVNQPMSMAIPQSLLCK